MVLLNRGGQRTPLIIDDSFITVPIYPAAAKVITDFIAAHRTELDEALAPHGLKLDEIAVPTYERLVWRDQVS